MDMQTPACLDTSSYPPPPWQLEGTALLRVQMLKVSQVRESVPAELSIVTALPGRTLGGILAVRYGSGSTLAYHELIVMPALVRHGTRVGGWISHIYVDDPRSCAAGREVWGLSKELAEFQWQTTARGMAVTVLPEKTHGQQSQALCRISASAPSRKPSTARHFSFAKRFPTMEYLRVPLFSPVLAIRNQSLIAFSGRGSGRLGKSLCDLGVHPESPFAHMALPVDGE